EEAFLYIQLSICLRRDGRLAEARTALEHARAVVPLSRDGEMDATIFDESSELRQAEGDLRGALDDALRAVDAARKGGVLFTRFSAADMRVRAAEVHVGLSHHSEAIALLREAVSVLESARGAYAGGA